MSSRAFIVETVTGHVIDEVEPWYSYDEALNAAETIKFSVPIEDPLEWGRDWLNLASPWKHSLVVEEHGHLMGGPIIPHSYEPGGLLEFTARGMRHMLSQRRVLPQLAYALGTLVLPDGTPDPRCDTLLEGYDLGTIGRMLVAQAMTAPGGTLPIQLQPVRHGTRRREYAGVELKTVDEALEQLSDVIGGPDFDFRPRWDGADQIVWDMVSGTEEQPRLASSTEHVWEVSADWSPLSDVSVETDPTLMGSASWATAGRGDDSVIVGYAWDPYLIDNGFPLMDLVDTSHTSVTDQDTIQGYADGNLARARELPQFWDFQAQAGESPRLPEYRVGDYCVLNVDSGGYLQAGRVRRRILTRSGAAGDPMVKITTGAVYG